MDEILVKENDRYWDCLDQAMEASYGGRTDEALAWLDEALKAIPNGAEAHNGRGEILWEEGRLEEASYELELATIADSKFVTAYLNRAELLLEDMGEFEQVIQICDLLLSGQSELPSLDRTIEAEVYYLKAKALFYLDDLEGSRFLIKRASKAASNLALYRAFEGQIAFEMGDFHEALSLLEHASVLEPEVPNSLYYLGLVFERLNKSNHASSAFLAAHNLDPDHYMIPVEFSQVVVTEATRTSIDNLPRSFRGYLDGVSTSIEDFPSQAIIAEEEVSPQVLGLFVGNSRIRGLKPVKELSQGRLVLYKKNLEKVCKNIDELVEQIQITIRQEIGYYLGLDEDDLDRLGLS